MPDLDKALSAAWLDCGQDFHKQLGEFGGAVKVWVTIQVAYKPVRPMANKELFEQNLKRGNADLHAGKVGYFKVVTRAIRSSSSPSCALKCTLSLCATHPSLFQGLTTRWMCVTKQWQRVWRVTKLSSLSTTTTCGCTMLEPRPTWSIAASALNYTRCA